MASDEPIQQDAAVASLGTSEVATGDAGSQTGTMGRAEADEDQPDGETERPAGAANTQATDAAVAKNGDPAHEGEAATINAGGTGQPAAADDPTASGAASTDDDAATRDEDKNDDTDDSSPPTDGGTSDPTEVDTGDPDDDAGASTDSCSGGPATYYRDSDNDGYGHPDDSYVGCTPPSTGNWVLQGQDCADWNPDVHPGQEGFFDHGYPLVEGDNSLLSFDYNCDGSEEQNPTQSLAVECSGLYLLGLGCSGGGYVPNDSRTLPDGANRYCGSNELSLCLPSGLTDCRGSRMLSDARNRCR